MDTEDMKKMMTQMKEEMKESMKTIAASTVTEVLKRSESQLARTTEKLERKRKADQVSFTKKGHEDQCVHGKEVEEKMDDAIECLEDGDIIRAKEKLQEGKNLIKLRAKYLRIADHEGWLTVQQFRSDELASDEEEEKKLKRAIRSASSLKEKLFKKPRFENKVLSSTPTKDTHQILQIQPLIREKWTKSYVIIAKELVIMSITALLQENPIETHKSSHLWKEEHNTETKENIIKTLRSIVEIDTSFNFFYFLSCLTFYYDFFCC